MSTSKPVPTATNPTLPAIAVRLARTLREREAAQRLRYEVFNVHEGLGLAESDASGLDQDEFDSYCDHLLVVDQGSSRVVGTYRLLPHHRVPVRGYYSETEFDMRAIKATGLRLLELGRSCVHPEFRRGRVIDVLFRGLGAYVLRSRAEALVGCVSVHGRDLDELRQVWRYLQAEGAITADDRRVEPLTGYGIPGVDRLDAPYDPTIADRLPPLFRAYLKLGAKVCGLPAYDAAFGTTDFFIMLDLTQLDATYARRFLRVC